MAFSGPLGLNWGWGQNRGRVVRSDELVLTFGDSYVCNNFGDKMLSYRRETALQGTLVLAESGRLELRDNILLIL